MTMASKKRSAAALSEDGELANDEILELHQFVEGCSGYFQCRACRMLPLDLRAFGSISLGRPSVEFVQNHSKICRGEVFCLDHLAKTMKEFIKTETNINSSILLQPRFKVIIREIVAHNEILVEVFTHGVEAVMKKKADADFATPGLWKKLPNKVSYEKVADAFEGFIVTTTDLFGKLGEFTLLLRYLQSICPALSVPAEVLASSAAAKKRAAEDAKNAPPPSSDEESDEE